MTVEKPQFRLDVQFGANLTLVMRTAAVADMRDAVKHQHGRGRQAGIARAEQVAIGASYQFVISVIALTGHKFSHLRANLTWPPEQRKGYCILTDL